MTSILQLHHRRPDGEIDSYFLKAGRRYNLGRGSQCQVRILDLKLSRQHCAFEHEAGTWNLIDLASTNGCTLDGSRVSGSLHLHIGAVIQAGNTSLVVKSVLDSSDEHPEPNDVSKTSSSDALSPFPVKGPPGQRPSGEPPAAKQITDSADDLQPQSAPNRATLSDPLIPGAPNTDVDHDVLATLSPGVKAPREPSEDSTVASIDSQLMFVHLLGRKVGPLTRDQAKDLKTREIYGTLTPGDLATVEAEAARLASTNHTAAPSDNEPATYFVTLLGKRVGPFTRVQARDLKARELRGDLSEEEIDRLMAH